MLLIVLMLLLEFASIIAIIAIIIIITINGSDGTLCAAVVERVGQRKCSQGRCGGEQGRRHASRAIRIQRAVTPEERRQSRATQGVGRRRSLCRCRLRHSRKLVELRRRPLRARR